MKDVAAHHLADESLDGYARRGVAVSRDAAHKIIAALTRDAHAMETRGGTANLTAASEQRELASAIGRSLIGRYL